MPHLTIQQALDAAMAHHQAGRLGDAEAMYRKILAAVPDQADAHHLLGVLAGQNGAHEAAVQLIRRAIAIDSSNPQYHFNLSVAYSDLGQFTEAIEACRAGLLLQPDNAEVISTLGTHLRELGHLDQAIEQYRKAIALKPGEEFYNNLAMALGESGAYDEAESAARRALEFRGDFPEAHWTLALISLLKGDFEQGWREYEWRWRIKSAPGIRQDPATEWDGGDLKGKTLLLYGEQGFGDTIQFARYAPLVAARGGRVIVQSRPELTRLFQCLPGILPVATGEAEPIFDVHFPLLSLPLIFATRLESIPAERSYLSADAKLIDQWRSRIEAAGSESQTKRLKIGVAWAGSATHRRDRERSMTLEQLVPLMQVPGVDFYSLQKGNSVAPPAGMKWVDLTTDLHDFADTAALVSHLDLVISVDTSVAHLAGALGKPVWVMLPFHPDWRWMLEREDTPWYPKMRLFRQKTRGDWKDVVERVARALHRFTPGTPHH